MSHWKVGPIRMKLGSVAPAPRGPQSDRATLQAIQAAAREGDLDRAASLAEAALAAGLEHPLVLNLAALKLEREGRMDEALVALRRAVELAPADVAARNALGLALLRLERNAEALAQFDLVLATEPGFAGAHCARGAALEGLGRLAASEVAYRRTLELQADNLAALSGLANILSRRAAHAEARALADRVLAAQPNYPDAVMVLARADLADAAPDAAEGRLEALIADPRLTPPQRAWAQGLMGDVLDAQDRVPEAFSAYTACNMGLWRAYAETYGGGQGALDFAREMIALLDEIGPEAWAPRGASPASPARRHVFLMGFPRSGTTLLEQVLAGHPDVETLEERDTLADAMRAFLSSPDDLARLAAADEAELAPLREAYWARVAAEGAAPDGKVFIDKHPLNTFRLPLIARLFPDAIVLFARRDPRDVVLSCYRRQFAMSGQAYQLLTLPGAAGHYDAAMRIAELFSAAPGARMHVVRHEALIADFDGVVGEVCRALGLTWTDEMHRFAERLHGVATPSAAQLAGGLSAQGVGQWRRYADQMAPVLPTLAPWVERFGYEAS